MDYKCDSCDKLFPAKENLKKHIKAVHEGKIRKRDFRCCTCDKIVKHMKQHIQNVHGSEENKCSSCGKSFSSRNFLEQHIRNVHEGKKDHKCDVCNKYFSQSTNLNTHIKVVHEKSKKFHCKFCELSFSFLDGLKSHIKNVHDDKSKGVYKCELCNKSFSQELSVQNHIKLVHEKAKQKECHKLIARDLQKLIQAIHEKKPYDLECKICRSFGQRSHLRTHIKLIHEKIKDKMCTS